MDPALTGLEELLGHRFLDQSLLGRALTHRSRGAELPHPLVRGDNEQLEFLGDAILGFLVSEALVARNPAGTEGRLSKLKARLVSADHLHEAAQSLRLGRFLILGRGEEKSGGRAKKTLLADAMEALIAALYLDGGMEAARSFVGSRIVPAPDACGPHEDGELTDYKSALQEAARALKLPEPHYAVIEEFGPHHAKTFVVEARLGQDRSSRAEGLSKKSASQSAARQLLDGLATRPLS